MSGRRASRRKRTRGELIGTHGSSYGEPVIFVASDPISRTGARVGQLLLAAQPVAGGPLQRAHKAVDTSREEHER